MRLDPLGHPENDLLVPLDPMYITVSHRCATCGKEVPTATDHQTIWVFVQAGKLLTYYCDLHRPSLGGQP